MWVSLKNGKITQLQGNVRVQGNFPVFSAKNTTDLLSAGMICYPSRHIAQNPAVLPSSFL